MTRAVASDADVRAALADLRARLPNAGVQTLVRALRTDHPGWAPPVDSKRVRALRNTAPAGPEVDMPPPRPDEEDVLGALEEVLARLCRGGDGPYTLRAAQIDMVLKLAFVGDGDGDGAAHSTGRRAHALHALPPPSAFAARSFAHLARARQYPARSCKLAATLALLLLASDAHVARALAWLSRALGGLPTAGDVAGTPSADVRGAWARARARARARAECLDPMMAGETGRGKGKEKEKKGETTALGVCLVDVEALERDGADAEERESFAHAFVLVVGPGGARVLQAWGEHGYSLPEYCHGGATVGGSAGRVRSVDEGDAFVDAFARLCGMAGAWSTEINALYAELFGVDVRALQRAGRMRRSMVGQFRAWVRVCEVVDVRVADVRRWGAVLDAVDGVLGL